MSREPQLTLDALRTLDAIDRRGSFAAAADELSKVPSALSYSIQKLEDELDLLLFDRSGHRATLTPVGRLILERGREILLATQLMIDDARLLSNGWEPEIVIGVETLFDEARLFPLVNELAEQANTRVRLESSVLSGTWELLDHDRADLIIGSDINAATTEVQTRYLYSDTMVFCAAPDHPIHQEETPLDPEVLSRYRAIAIADSAINRPKREVRLFDEQPRLTVASLPLKLKALCLGLGIGTLPQSRAADLLASGELVTIGDGQPQTVDLQLAWKNHKMGQAKQWFMRRITELCKTL
ncbi:LysR family transcriptional regulator [Halioxenophilus sp. WMMB6]|uniref:LysR family transcriptional regulator n=1 Tax=Halioxenophilus sp. WMMB6 TaxID=3073815 RepID=UPI00295EA019|nr:LysR family transcriptional regulator [Halioxenophilus sp. WMMB6]